MFALVYVYTQLFFIIHFFQCFVKLEKWLFGENEKNLPKESAQRFQPLRAFLKGRLSLKQLVPGSCMLYLWNAVGDTDDDFIQIAVQSFANQIEMLKVNPFGYFVVPLMVVGLMPVFLASSACVQRSSPSFRDNKILIIAMLRTVIVLVFFHIHHRHNEIRDFITILDKILK